MSSGKYRHFVLFPIFKNYWTDFFQQGEHNEIIQMLFWNKVLLHAVPEVNSHFPRWRKTDMRALQPWRGWVKLETWASIQIWRSPWHFLHCVGCSSLSHFPRAAYGTAWPVDIYKLIWLRAMAFYKEKHLHNVLPLFPWLRVLHVIALNKHESTFAGRLSLLPVSSESLKMCASVVLGSWQAS